MGEAIGGDGAARGVLKHLTQKDRATLYILADERRDRQVWFPTFGRALEPSGNLSIALRLARKVGAQFLPFYLVRTSGPHFALHWHPPLDPRTMSDAEIVAVLDRFLGQACIDHADQWLALHDMDLTQPV
jgi:Kdo2-lipid IVA lauroyltransferase/acyltransferase